jgi:integrase/recombinase XerC/integrase/recombinase XerD
MMKAIVKASGGDIIKALNVPELVSSFLASQDVREISKLAYQKGLERFLSWLAENGNEQPDRESILKFKSFMVESGLSANTVNSYLVAVKRFFGYLEGIRKYPDVAKGIKGVAQPRDHLKESLTAAQVKELLSQVDISAFQGRRDFAIINLMVRTGLRTIEVVRADVEDVKQEGGEALLFVQGKGRDSKDSFVILTEKALKPILAYLKERAPVDPGDPLFASISDRNKGRRLGTRTIRRLIKDYLKKINIESRKLSAHSLRHSFATLTLRAGAPLIQVRDALRHASIETTQKYLHNIERIEKGAERYIDF